MVARLISLIPSTEPSLGDEDPGGIGPSCILIEGTSGFFSELTAGSNYTVLVYDSVRRTIQPTVIGIINASEILWGLSGMLEIEGCNYTSLV